MNGGCQADKDPESASRSCAFNSASVSDETRLTAGSVINVGANAAMRAHATQIAVDGPFFALSNNVGMEMLGIEYFRSPRDSRLFYIHSIWVDEALFQVHANLPHTVRFLEQVEAAIDHPLEVTRLLPLE